VNEEKKTLLYMKNIHVSYGGIKALKGVDFEVQEGEFHALVGEHRAGKSSLVKLLSGVVQKEYGEIRYDGRIIESFTPQLSMKSGIGIVYQDVQVISSLTTMEYLFAGRMIKKWYGCLDLDRMAEETKELLSNLGIDLDIECPLSELTVAQRNMAELARAVLHKPKFLILDEISSKLTPEEMEIVYKIIAQIKKEGGSVIYITHNMDEIFRFADRVTILKDGYRRGTEKTKDLDKIRLIKLTYSFVLSREELQKTNINLFYFKQYNEAIIKNLPIGVVILDSENKTYMMNFAAVKNLEIDSGYAENEPFDRLMSFASAEIKKEIQRGINTREQSVWNEVSYSNDKYLNISIYPFHNEDYVFLGTIILIDDITKERQFNEYLLRTEKIASVENLAAGVAHEINNPLGIIQNYLQIVKGKNLEENVQDKILRIESELHRIVDIVDNLLTFSKVEIESDRKIEVASLIDDVLLLLHHKIEEKNITLEWNNHKQKYHIEGDENRLKQLFINIIVNSIEAVINGGLIRIKIKPNRNKEFLNIEVADNGCGIPEDIVNAIFEPFYSTKVNKKNTGLGLAICQHIADLYHGRIFCKSSPGEMTAFTIQFPISAAKE